MKRVAGESVTGVAVVGLWHSFSMVVEISGESSEALAGRGVVSIDVEVSSGVSMELDTKGSGV